ncbi:uncharacterized protein FYW61_015661 [Anableps anableps]
MPAVKSFIINYDALNEEGTFYEGDTVTGEVILSLSKCWEQHSFRQDSMYLKRLDMLSFAPKETPKLRNKLLKKWLIKISLSNATPSARSSELKIPADEMPSIENCDIILVTHQLKVYLDISFAFDPEIIFPVVISHPTLMGSGPVGPYPAGAFGGPANSDFPPPAMAVGPYPAPPPSGPYGYPGAQSPSAPPPAYPSNPQVYCGPPGAYPAQPPPMYGAHNNPVSQGPSPYGAPFSSSTIPHPPPGDPAFHVPPLGPQIQPPFSSVSPSAPTFNPMPSAPEMNTDFLSQNNDVPPAYTSLFPSPTPEKSDTK